MNLIYVVVGTSLISSNLVVFSAHKTFESAQKHLKILKMEVPDCADIKVHTTPFYENNKNEIY